MTSADLDTADRAIVNAFQGGFPVVRRPYEPAAAALCEAGVDLTAYELVSRVRRLCSRGVLSRFGALVNADEIGGATTLAAMSVPVDRFEAVAEVVNGYDEVAHNYERDHDLNMWFVVSVADPERIGEVLESIERETGLAVYSLPKCREFRLEARFPIEGPLREGIDLSSLGPDVEPSGRAALSPRECDLVVCIQDGFPHSATPYRDIGERIGEPVEWVIEAIVRFDAEDKIRRIGVVPNHYAIGYTENAMTVWDVPDESIGAVGRALGALPFVTHCYARPRHPGIWPYNLFAMVHGRSEEEATARFQRVREAVTDVCGPAEHETLYSTQILKKEGIRLSERAARSSEHVRGASR